MTAEIISIALGLILLVICWAPFRATPWRTRRFARRLVRRFARHQRRNGGWVVDRPPTPKFTVTTLPGSAVGTDDSPAPTTRLAWVMTPDIYFQWDENGNKQVIGPNGVIPEGSPDYPLRAVEVVRSKGDDKETNP